MFYRRMGVVAALAGMLVLAACGSDGDTGGSPPGTTGATVASDTGASDAGEAASRWAQFEGEPEWEAPGAAFDASAASGKVVWYVSIDHSIPIVQTFANELKDALEHAGVALEVCDGKGNPTEWKRCFNLAIARGADLIIDESIDPQFVSDSVAAADEAGIPVIDGNLADPGADPLPGFAARVALPFRQAGSLVADWVIADSGGEAKVLVLSTSDNPNAPEVTDNGILKEFAELCPACEITVREAPTAQWATDLGPLTQSALTADPSIEYVVPIYDGMATFILGPIEQSGAGDRVQVATFNANLDPMKNMADGNLIYADVGSNNAFVGWAYADQALRLLSGEPPVGEQIPLRVFTRENIGDLELTPEAERSGEWFGAPVFKDEFLELWGVQ